MATADISTTSMNKPSRFLGGSSEGAIHPFIKGYFYVFFSFPEIITVNSDTYNGIKSNGSNVLMSLCEGFQPPGDRQLKYEDVMGMGGVDSSFITGQTIDRNFSLNFRDIWGAPVFRIHRAWTSIIDPIYGGLVKNTKTTDFNFVPKEYKGKVLVVQTKPIAFDGSNQSIKEEDIIKVDLFDGVFPTTDLSSMYDSNIADNTIVKPTVQYRFDGTKYDETQLELSKIKTIMEAQLKNKRTSSISDSQSFSITTGTA